MKEGEEGAEDEPECQSPMLSAMHSDGGYRTKVGRNSKPKVSLTAVIEIKACLAEFYSK